jgi:hypothetical protein
MRSSGQTPADERSVADAVASRTRKSGNWAIAGDVLSRK